MARLDLLESNQRRTAGAVADLAEGLGASQLHARSRHDELLGILLAHEGQKAGDLRLSLDGVDVRVPRKKVVSGLKLAGKVLWYLAVLAASAAGYVQHHREAGPPPELRGRP